MASSASIFGLASRPESTKGRRARTAIDLRSLKELQSDLQIYPDRLPWQSTDTARTPVMPIRPRELTRMNLDQGELTPE